MADKTERGCVKTKHIIAKGIIYTCLCIVTDSLMLHMRLFLHARLTRNQAPENEDDDAESVCSFIIQHLTFDNGSQDYGAPKPPLEMVARSDTIHMVLLAFNNVVVMADPQYIRIFFFFWRCSCD
jgi:hypothetical protein